MTPEPTGLTRIGAANFPGSVTRINATDGLARLTIDSNEVTLDARWPWLGRLVGLRPLRATALEVECVFVAVTPLLRQRGVGIRTRTGDEFYFYVGGLPAMNEEVLGALTQLGIPRAEDRRTKTF